VLLLKLANPTDLDRLRKDCRKLVRERAGVRNVLVHMGTCGIASGSRLVLDQLEEKLADSEDVSLRQVGCCGVCHSEPMITVIDPDGRRTMYGELDKEKLDRILGEHIQGGRVQEDLRLDDECDFFRKQVKRVTRLLGQINPYEIREYIGEDGYVALGKALSISPREVIDEVSKSGLRGRGGAGFPTGMKWSFAAREASETKYMICNADEGDPGAYMDRAIIEGNPFSVLEGLTIGAYAIGANFGYIYIRAEYPLAVEILRNAIEKARSYGLLGQNILGSGFDFDVEICLGAGAFVCGEETALIASIEGHRGNPRPKPPFPASKGLFGKPTIINNVKTLSNIPLIFLNGADWFTSVGTEKSKGTMIFSLTGKVQNTGLIEVPLGIPLGEVIFDIGGGIPNGKAFKAVQLGGPSGGCIPGKYLNTPVDYSEIEALGAIMGSGGMIVMDEDSCMPDMARFFMEFTKEESCGKCTPCRAGIPQMLRILESVCSGTADESDLGLLEELGAMVKECSLCGLGQTAPNPVLSTLRHFRDEYMAHIVDGYCSAAVCQSLFNAPCQHACPLGTNIPGIIALVKAGRLEEAYVLLRQYNPLPTVCGRVCVHYCESKCRRSQVDEGLSINHVLRFVSENAMARGLDYVPTPSTPTGKRVAIVGSGPAGLSSAHDLSVKGHQVVVFESTDRIGGMLVWGIPEYRLPREVLDRDVEVLEKLGVQFRLGSRIDDPRKLLEDGYDAVFLAAGLQKGRQLRIPGSDLEGVYEGVDFLRRINEGEKIKIGRSVAVVGGGNVAVDAARVGLRLGAERSVIIYRREKRDMPAIEEEALAAEEEGVEIVALANPTRILGKGGKVTGVECLKMALSGFDDSCRKVPRPVEGSEFTIDVDAVIMAIGQVPEDDLGKWIELNAAGLIDCDGHTLETSVPGVFAGGDVVSGASTVVEAISAGQRAAFAIDRYLRGEAIPPRVRRSPDVEIQVPVEELKEEVEEQPRVAWACCPACERVRDFREVARGYDPKQAKREAERCLRCDLEV
jgi:NADH-quinone oxidoreductase subunit F